MSFPWENYFSLSFFLTIKTEILIHNPFPSKLKFQKLCKPVFALKLIANSFARKLICSKIWSEWPEPGGGGTICNHYPIYMWIFLYFSTEIVMCSIKADLAKSADGGGIHNIKHMLKYSKHPKNYIKFKTGFAPRVLDIELW